MDFNRITYDGTLTEMDKDELRTIINEFEEAQTNNMAEAKTAKQKIDDLESEVEEKREFKYRLAESLAEVSPLSEEEAMTYNLARVEELIEEFSEAEEDEDGRDERPRFADMGRRGETHNEDEQKEEFAKEQLGDIPGVNL